MKNQLKNRKIALVIVLLCLGSTGAVLGVVQWNRNLGGNLEVLVAQYGAELYEDPACTIIATSVAIEPIHQGDTSRTEALYLKNTGGGRLFVYWQIQWLSSISVPTYAEYSHDGHTFQRWNEGPLEPIDTASQQAIQIRWAFQVPAGATVSATYQYSITLTGDSEVPSA